MPPPAVLDSSPGAHRCLVPGLKARRRLDPGLGARRRLIPHPEHAAAVLFLKPVIVALAVVFIDLDPTSLGLCLPSAPPGRRYRPPAMVTPSPPSLPLSCEFERNLVRFERTMWLF
jgi:hypothetical protein